jgi:hypothetical protein
MPQKKLLTDFIVACGLPVKRTTPPHQQPKYTQKTSAGSAVRTLRIAIIADNPHITIVSTNTNTALSTVIENCI